MPGSSPCPDPRRGPIPRRRPWRRSHHGAMAVGYGAQLGPREFKRRARAKSVRGLARVFAAGCDPAGQGGSKQPARGTPSGVVLAATHAPASARRSSNDSMQHRRLWRSVAALLPLRAIREPVRFPGVISGLRGWAAASRRHGGGERRDRRPSARRPPRPARRVSGDHSARARRGHRRPGRRGAPDRRQGR